MLHPTHSLLGRALARLLPTRMPQTPPGFPSPLRGEVRGGGARGAGKPARADTKASRTGPLLAFDSLRQPVWSPRDYAAFAREGFAQNAVVYRSVRMIAEAAASVPLLLYEGEHEIESHPLLDLIARPNPVASAPDLLEAWYGFLLVSGNAYLEAVSLGGELRELHALRPDRMKVIPGPDGWPEAFEYSAGGRSVRFAEEVLPGVRPILHVKLFNPVNDHYGLSPIEAAATAIDIHNTAARWNKALLDNSARPSGALVYTSRDGNLSPEQIDRLKAELEQGFQGAAHAGRPLLLEGGLDWKSMSLTPKDMDFVEAKHAAAREIALALGVPPMLLGIPGDNTYSNYQEANRTFWRQTVLPLVNRTAKALSAWLAPAFAADSPLELRPDLDTIEALSPEREALWARLEKATFLTPDEKRAAVGYGPLEEPAPPPETSAASDDLSYKYPGQPRTVVGQFDFGRLLHPVQSGGGSKYRIDLQEEKLRGGHAIEKHVGKTPEWLLAAARGDRFVLGAVERARKRWGTFPSLDAANKLVNATLAQNEQLVDLVAGGKLQRELITANFSSKTGIEAYAPSIRAQHYIQDTHGVGVVIIHDPLAKNGFTVLTAYPRND